MDESSARAALGKRILTPKYTARRLAGMAALTAVNAASLRQA